MNQIRIAKEQDADEVYHLIGELEETKFDKESFLAVYLYNLKEAQIHYLVYEQDGAILGFLSVHMQQLLHHIGKIAEIQEFIVSKTARGNGIGTQMFEKAKEISIQNQCIQLEVCCNQKRIQSHKFYEAQGMTNHHYKFCYTF